MDNELRYRYLDDPLTAEDALHRLHGADEMALDLEADSLHSYREKVCLVQISTTGGNIILDPLACGGPPKALRSLLEDPGTVKVIHGGNYDVRLLKRDFGIQTRNIFDTMIAAQMSGREKFGLASLLSELFGVHLDKKHQRADWSSRPLSSSMKTYAASDTAYLLDLKKVLQGELASMGRQSWVEEEFALLEEVVPLEPKKPSAFDVKGSRRLSPAQRGMLQRLVEIREQAALDMDRPPFKVLSQKVLLLWAHKPPRCREELLGTPGASSRILQRLAPALLRAFRSPPAPLSRPAPGQNGSAPLTGEEKKKLQSLKKVRGLHEERLRLPPGLLVNSATLEKMCRMKNDEAASFVIDEFKKWQRDLIGSDLLKVLQGAQPGSS